MVVYTIVNVAVFAVCITAMFRKKPTKAMSIDNTNGVREFFILLMIAHHVSQHIPDNGVWPLIFGSVGGLLTGIFFFLSGYGNYYSYCKRKNENRVKWIFQRITAIILPFEVIYPIFYFISGHTGLYIKGTLTLTFPEATNWFIKVMLGCYVIFFLIYFILPFRMTVKNAILLMSTAAAIIIFIFLKMDTFWWSSVLCFPLGVYYAHYKEKTDMLLDKWYIFATSFGLFAAAHVLNVKVSRYFEIAACVLAVIAFLCVNKKFTLNSKIFQLPGTFSYEIYLIHVGLLSSVYNVTKLSELQMLIIYCVTLLGGFILHSLVHIFSNYFIKKIN